MEWEELIPSAGGAPAQADAEPERSGGCFARLRERLSKSRQALRVELSASLFDKIDEETFDATQRNFEELVEHLFPGGRGRLRLVDDSRGPKPVLGGGEQPTEAAEDAPEPEEEGDEFSTQGVEIEVTPAGKATRRLSLLSGGEKALVALAFVFSVFLARPSPFYILDEVEAALDDANIDRFLQLVNRFSDRAQFIIVTHQKRTMDAADTLYGVSMGGDGVSRVISRKLAGAPADESAGADHRAA